MTIKSDNEAFADNAGAEVARILRAMADMIGAGQEGHFRLMDHNGNGVGRAVLEVWTEEA
jgi:hypothetical protein